MGFSLLRFRVQGLGFGGVWGLGFRRRLQGSLIGGFKVLACSVSKATRTQTLRGFQLGIKRKKGWRVALSEEK